LQNFKIRLYCHRVKALLPISLYTKRKSDKKVGKNYTVKTKKKKKTIFYLRVRQVFVINSLVEMTDQLYANSVEYSTSFGYNLRFSRIVQLAPRLWRWVYRSDIPAIGKQFGKRLGKGVRIYSAFQ